MFAQVRNLFRLISFILILMTPVYSWGFSFERTQAYLEQAKFKNLTHHPQWIKLNHYKKTLGRYKSPFSSGLFISENGALSPVEELTATIKLLFSNAEIFLEKNKEHPQCFYLARTQWLLRVLRIDPQDVVECTEKTAWKKDLNVESVSLIFAAGDLSNASSIFGHTFLKLNNPKNQGQKDLLNYGIDYAAEADASEGLFYAVKGLFGFYPGQFAMLPFHQKILDYTNIEGRDIWEFRLNLTAEETEFLVNHLLEMERARAPYYFADDNCATQILRTLEAVRPEINIADQLDMFVVPIETVKLVERTPGLVVAVNYKPALKTEFERDYKRLNSQQKDFLPILLKNLNFSEARNEFTKSEKAQLLEAAASAISLQEFQKKIDLEEQKYQLYLQRIDLGQGAATKSGNIPPSPTQSHDSFALFFGAYNGGLTFKARSAFHDLEQPHDGLIPHSHIETLSLSFRTSSLDQKFHFDRFTLLKIINLAASNSLEAKMAWKASIEFLDGFGPDLEGGLGSSYAVTENDDLRFSALLSARYWQQSYFDHHLIADGKWSALGPEVLISFHPFNQFGISFSSTYFFVDQHQDFLRNQFRLNWNFYPGLDLQLHYKNHIEPTLFNNEKNENGISIVLSTII